MSKKFKVRSKRYRASSRIAGCYSCDWTNECNLKALKEARKHCAETGHTTSVESNDVMQYDALKDKPK